jgi:DNA-binding HxlR family transcriptional regulator
VQTDYELTAAGESLAAAVSAVRKWAYDHIEEIGQARRAFGGDRRERQSVTRA